VALHRALLDLEAQPDQPAQGQEQSQQGVEAEEIIDFNFDNPAMPKVRIAQRSSWSGSADVATPLARFAWAPTGNLTWTPSRLSPISLAISVSVVGTTDRIRLHSPCYRL